MRVRALLRHPFTWAFAAITLLYLGLVLFAPSIWVTLAAKEGPFEHVGHAVLTVALVYWIRLASRRAGHRLGSRLLAVAISGFLVFAWLEELDWGAVYGVDLGYTWVSRITGGSVSFHNAQRTHGSLVVWVLPWMTAPMLLYFAAPLVPVARLGHRWESWAPSRATRAEGLLFFAAAALTICIDSVPLVRWRIGSDPRAPGGDPIGSPLGLYQVAFYLLWLLVARRALHEPAPGASSGDGVT